MSTPPQIGFLFFSNFSRPIFTSECKRNQRDTGEVQVMSCEKRHSIVDSRGIGLKQKPQIKPREGRFIFTHFTTLPTNFHHTLRTLPSWHLITWYPSRFPISLDEFLGFWRRWMRRKWVVRVNRALRLALEWTPLSNWIFTVFSWPFVETSGCSCYLLF